MKILCFNVEWHMYALVNLTVISSDNMSNDRQQAIISGNIDCSLIYIIIRDCPPSHGCLVHQVPHKTTPLCSSDPSLLIVYGLAMKTPLSTTF